MSLTGGERVLLTGVSPTGGPAATQETATVQDVANFAVPITTGVTPTSGGDQANAAQLNYGWNFLSPGDGGATVQLPAAVSGSLVVVVPPDGVLYLLFAKNGTADTINGQSNATAFDMLQTLGPTILGCTADGAWRGNCQVD